MNTLIRVEDLCVWYEDFPALVDVSFEIKAGHVVALVGPNGAGKTSLFRTMFGRQPKVRGRVSLCNLNPFEANDYRKLWQVARWVEDTPRLYEELTVREFLEFSGRAFGVPERDLRSKILDVAMNLEVHDRLDHRIGSLSHGMKRKTYIASGFLSGRSGPQVMVMDEPTVGLDPPSRLTLGDFLHRYVNPSGMGSERAVLVSSHNLAELSSFADSVLMLDRGRIVQAGSVEELLAQQQTDLQYEITLFDPQSKALAESLRKQLQLECTPLSDMVLLVECADVEAVQGVIHHLSDVATRYPVREFRERRTSLERLYYRRLSEGRVS